MISFLHDEELFPLNVFLVGVIWSRHFAKNEFFINLKKFLPSGCPFLKINDLLKQSPASISFSFIALDTFSLTGKCPPDKKYPLLASLLCVSRK